MPIKAFYNDELVRKLGSKENAINKIKYFFTIAQAHFFHESLHVKIALDVKSIIYVEKSYRNWKADSATSNGISINREIPFDSNVQAHVVFAENELVNGVNEPGIAVLASVCHQQYWLRLSIVELYGSDFDVGWVNMRN